MPFRSSVQASHLLSFMSFSPVRRLPAPRLPPRSDLPPSPGVGMELGAHWEAVQQQAGIPGQGLAAHPLVAGVGAGSYNRRKAGPSGVMAEPHPPFLVSPYKQRHPGEVRGGLHPIERKLMSEGLGFAAWQAL